MKKYLAFAVIMFSVLAGNSFAQPQPGWTEIISCNGVIDTTNYAGETQGSKVSLEIQSAPSDGLNPHSALEIDATITLVNGQVQNPDAGGVLGSKNNTMTDQLISLEEDNRFSESDSGVTTFTYDRQKKTFSFESRDGLFLEHRYFMTGHCTN
jgi:hypothetical protein